MSENQETYGSYSVDDEDQPGAEDTLDPGGPREDVPDELDKGYSPPERYSAGQGYGNTPLEEAQGETLDQRLEQELPDDGPGGAEQDPATPEVVDSGEVGAERAGRLSEPGQEPGDAPTYDDAERDLVGDDVGVDGEAASAEEAAVHVVPEEPLDEA